MDWQNIVIVVLLALAAVIVTGGVAVLRARFAVALFHPLQSRFGLRHPEDPDGAPRLTELTGQWDVHDARVAYEITPWYEPNRVVYTLRHDIPVQGDVAFRRRTRMHRIARRIGLIPESGATDRDFNRTTYPEADHDEDVPGLVADAGVRESILRLLRHRGAHVTVHPHGVSASFATRHLPPGPGPRSRVSPTFAMEAFTALQVLAHAASGTRRMPRRGREPVHPRPEEATPVDTPSDEELATLASALSAHPLGSALLVGPTMLFIGPAVLLWSIEFSPITWTLHLIGLAAGLLLLAGQALLAYHVLHGRTRALREFSLLVVSAGIGFVCLGPGTAVSVNGAFDPGPASAEPARVEHRLLDGRFVLVRLEDRPSRLLSVTLPPARYRELEVGDTMDVLVSPGALEHSWMVGPAPQTTPQ